MNECPAEFIIDLPGPSVDPLTAQLETACVLEAAARKAGNVHPLASFADLTFQDFCVAARVSAPLLAQAHAAGVGRSVLEGVTATQRACRSNVNLGILLLLAPLASAAARGNLRDQLPSVLTSFTQRDSEDIYAAIRLAQPGGLQQIAEHDVAAPPRLSLLEAMTLAAPRDLIAREFATGFAMTTIRGPQLLADWFRETRNLEGAILGLQLSLVAQSPDTLIERKLGRSTADAASQQAQHVLQAGWPHSRSGRQAWDDWDAWLRGDGHRRNPGATADLIAAILFVVIHAGELTPPRQFVLTGARPD